MRSLPQRTAATRRRARAPAWWALVAFALGAVPVPVGAGEEAKPAPASEATGPAARRVTAADFRGGKLRGVTLADPARGGAAAYPPGDFAALEAIGVNLVRVMILLDRCAGCDRYDFPLAQANHVDALLAESERRGLKVIVALQPEPAGDRAEYWRDERLKASIRDVWAQLAARFRSSRAVAAYDLINEPVPPGARAPGEANRQWVPFAATLIRAIRSVDPERVVVFEPAPWAFPAAFASLEPLPFDNVVYSFHFYHPHALTHQGIYDYPLGPRYPSADWHRARLSRELEPVRAFAARHGAAVYAGEFSCVRWAPGGSAARYVGDLVELFGAEGWSWTYHTWRGYQGWDAEIPGDAPRTLTPARAAALRRSDAPVLSAIARALQRPADRPAASGATR